MCGEDTRVAKVNMSYAFKLLLQELMALLLLLVLSLLRRPSRELVLLFYFWLVIGIIGCVLILLVGIGIFLLGLLGCFSLIQHLLC